MLRHQKQKSFAADAQISASHAPRCKNFGVYFLSKKKKKILILKQ
jgi:hypothetical protein